MPTQSREETSDLGGGPVDQDASVPMQSRLNPGGPSEFEQMPLRSLYPFATSYI